MKDEVIGLVITTGVLIALIVYVFIPIGIDFFIVGG